MKISLEGWCGILKTIPKTKQDIEFWKGKLDRMPLDGSYSVCIEEVPTQLKVNQRNMYFAWMTYLSEYYSGTKDDKNYYHEAMKKEFLTPQKIKRFGFVEDYYTIKGMKKKEFAEYMTQVYDKCFEMGIELPRILGKEYDALVHIYGNNGNGKFSY